MSVQGPPGVRCGVRADVMRGPALDSNLSLKLAESAKSDRVERWSSTPCSLLRRGRRIQPAERGPGGGLTATYCTQLGMIQK